MEDIINIEKYTLEEIEDARVMFSKECRFVAGAMYEHQLPEPTLPEVAFAGRSNVGKSSIINTLLFRKKLVKTSSNPGHTKQVNIFNLQDKINLVDLPGYGYAKASKSEMYRWSELIQDYLKGRSSLQRVILLIDSRRGIKKLDIEIMNFLDKMGLSYQIVFTKIDKIKKYELNKNYKIAHEITKKHPACYPNIYLTSSLKETGLEYIRTNIYRLYKNFG